MKMLIKPLIVLGLLAMAIGVFYSPYHAVDQMREAAEARDTERLSRYVDFPAVREDVRESLSDSLSGELNRAMRDSPFGAMGLAVADALLRPLVDAVISPTALAAILRGYMPVTDGTDGVGLEARDDVQVSLRYEAFDRFVIRIAADNGEAVDMVLHRQNLFWWRLSALRLPL
ncbi:MULTISPECIES: DUF2939 domain-containing protein [Ectothiorhodospira]|nr:MULTISPECIES: DUF2939 domain-containing protein [Ectothiorhodospira]MCG5495191.1 DUF2939 domain-containing protein [Ectothiorhodospira variabilis]MCG5498481.1 DUF2939 domain-containing protein [Ectothiorhodospira variabilis]MCG5504259.1 DUF2939 domain-containing protein [Ectothiorhodospira variabilis]MCG5507414.1 DUF2939 domain-containing protein [Ectothiorhodospira variabilis]MCG5525672.1 DUF2939 domain-containing protein [Ectothiorhodospira haloalkaliphila]